MHKKIDENIDNQIEGKYNYKNANYYNFFELDYYKLYIFNQLDNLSNVFHIQNNFEPECQYYNSQFLSNNKLYNHI